MGRFFMLWPDIVTGGRGKLGVDRKMLATHIASIRRKKDKGRGIEKTTLVSSSGPHPHPPPVSN